MKKGCLVSIGLVLLAVGGIVFFLISATSGVVDGGKAFLALLGAGKVQEAYQSAAGGLRSQQDLEAFTKSVTALGLTEYASASFTNRSVNNDKGHLEGTVTTRSGGAIPLSMDLVKEDGAWKVFSLSAPEAGVTKDQPAKTVKALPTEEESKVLVQDTLLALNAAVKDKSFVGFHKGIAELWRKQTTPEQLQGIFQSFIDKEIDLAGIKELEPTFDSPAEVNADGLLVLKGSYPTTPEKVLFDLKYIEEQAKWKLVGIDVKTK